MSKALAILAFISFGIGALIAISAVNTPPNISISDQEDSDLRVSNNCVLQEYNLQCSPF